MAEQRMRKTTPIVFLTDNNYAVPTAVAIQSLIDHWAGAKPLRIYVLVHEVCEEYRNRFLRFCSDEVQLELIDSDLDGDSLSGYYDTGSYVSTTSMLKFCIPRLLPNDDAILYLDGDILVQKDLSPLTRMDVSAYYAAAVEDIAAIKSVQLDKIVGVTRYFNSGVLLLNAKRFREEGLEKTLFAIGLEHPDYMCRDQSVFNKGFFEQVLWLPPTWNLMAFNLRYANYSMVLINTFYETNYANIEEMEQHAALIHLTNKYKPWTYLKAYRSKEWFEVFRRTPFSDISIKLIPIVEEPPQPSNVFVLPNGHIIKKIGLLVKDWSLEETCFSLFGATFARKIKRQDLQEIRLFGIPLYRKKFDPEYVTTRILGVRVRKRENLEAIATRVERNVDQIISEKTGSYTWAKDDPFVYFVIRQLEVLDRLKSRRGNKK